MALKVTWVDQPSDPSNINILIVPKEADSLLELRDLAWPAGLLMVSLAYALRQGKWPGGNWAWIRLEKVEKVQQISQEDFKYLSQLM